MTRILGLGLLCAAFCWGCGDDDGGGGGGDTDSGPPAPTGMCTNMSDSAAVMATYTVDGMMMDVAQIAGACARMCALSGMDTPECVTTCMDEDTMNAISDGCKTCFLMSIDCVRMHCLSRCLSDPEAPDCLACQCGDNDTMINCRDVFSDCSGIPSDDCM